MSPLGPLVLDGVARATAFAVVGVVAYLVLRRWSPAAGALAAVSCLSGMALVGALALAPLPTWDPGPVLRLLPAAPPARPGLAPIAAPPPGASFGWREVFTLARAPEPSASAPAKPSIATALPERSSLPSPETQAGWGWTGWLMLALTASIGIGLLRLASGLLSMRGLVARSRPVEDPELRDLLDVLRAEMSCARTVSIRESAELATPAAVGVRRPLILLPEDWPGWDANERRAVLAHELAHVARGDFAAGLLAQLSVAVQFYHPLAHWFLSRHRLDQELAADAWSARLAGGNASYLAALARLALRQDDRPVGWPARAFLPRHGTLVRRIEMLRRKRAVRHVFLSTPFRLATFAMLAGLGVLVAGLRAPGAAGQTPGAAAPGPIAERAAPAVKPFDLAYLPAETRIVVGVQPAALLGRPGMATLAESLARLGQSPDSPPLPLESIEQMLIFLEGSSGTPPAGAPTVFNATATGATVRLVQAGSARALVERLIPAPRSERHAGQEYFIGAETQGLAAFLPSDRTVVFARRDVLLSLIDDRDLPAPRQNWDESWKQVSDRPIAVAADARWIRREYRRLSATDQGRNPDPRVEMFSPLLEKVVSYGVGLDLAAELKLHLVAQAARAEDVKAVNETLQAALTLGRNAAASLREEGNNRPGKMAEFHAWAGETAVALLGKASLETAGQTVHLRSTAPVDGATVGRLAGLSVTTARDEAARSRSANNVKQIALAFHNYADANGHLPPPVVLGGKSGKVPHSWRVALLPYLDQDALYRAYNFDEPWDGPNNRKLLDQMPAIFSTSGHSGGRKSTTDYFVLSGPEAALGKEGGTGLADITDGTSNTILVVEARRDVPWTRPEDIDFDDRADPPKLGGFHPDGFNAAFGDGSTRFIRNTIAPHILKALITRNGGEVIDHTSY
ncbi:MAG: M56 family metallopeptidase [Isosphaeraceae bacterium]